MKHLLYLTLLLFSCSGNGQTETKTEEKQPAYPSATISETENAKNTKLVQDAAQKAQSLAADNSIVLGYEVGMKEAACDAHTLKLVEEGKLQKSGNDAFNGEYLFHFGDGTTTPVDIHASASGMFENFPRITFRTPKSDMTMEEIVVLRNRFVEWAIETYGETFYVTINHSYPDGTSSNMGTNNYTWIVGSYRVDIVIGSKRVALTYSLNK